MGKLYRIVLLLLFAAGWVNAMPTLTVATDAWPPFRILQPDGQLQGIDIEILHRLEQESGIRLQVKRMPWGRALKQMQTGQVDLMIGLAHTPERAQFIDYLQPAYYQCWPAFYGKREQVARLDQYSHLLGVKVGFVLNSAYFEPFDSDIRLDKHGVATEEQLLRMVQRGHLPLMIGTDCQVDYALSREPTLALAKAPYRPARPITLYLGMSKRSPYQDLKLPLAQALQTLVVNGEIQQIARPYQP
ncbi:transporter substrate-binding domain-containing protein [Aeromonas jandaei]|uniref:substrate-binding periplasmic protein n=1 Tax=Aeromonas jandaei TaxID=650 RepID=UPI00191E6BEF|nr:transporter substrate-binding domain-containing protein [Aeromonas jandaei]MBL0596767.1 transporter substrate-binding domain-containing protein [Aeromonas jandaei]